MRTKNVGLKPTLKADDTDWVSKFKNFHQVDKNLKLLVSCEYFGNDSCTNL